LNSLEEKITAHYGTIYLISFTKFSLRSSAMRVKFSQTYKKITSSFGVDYFLLFPKIYFFHKRIGKIEKYHYI